VDAIQIAIAEGTTIVIVSAGKSIPYTCNMQPLRYGGAAFLRDANDFRVKFSQIS
jgi:hypothetical protein